MTNNPLHSLIYACIANWHCINAIAKEVDIRTELAIMGDSVDEQVREVIERELNRRLKSLELLMKETRDIIDNLDNIIKPPPVEDELDDQDGSKEWDEGYDAPKGQINPYKLGSYERHMWQRGYNKGHNDAEPNPN